MVAAEIRGDAEMALGRRDAARASYEKALASLDIAAPKLPRGVSVGVGEGPTGVLVGVAVGPTGVLVGVGPPLQPGNVKEPMRVCQFVPVAV